MRRFSDSTEERSGAGEVGLRVLDALEESAVVVFDRGLYCILLAGGATETLGWTRGAAQERHVWNVMPSSARGDLASAFKSALDGDTTRIDFAPAESYLIFALEVKPFSRSDGTVVAGLAVAHDVTDKRRAGRRLARVRSAFDNAPIGMGISTPDGRWLQVNGAFCQIVGHAEGQLLGTSWEDITYPDDLPAARERVEQLLAGDLDRYDVEKRFFTANGHIVWAWVFQSIVRDAAGRPLHLVSHVFDISERKRAEQELQERANRDPPTGLFNRGRFEEELERQVARCKRYGERAALLLVDVDRLKETNDQFGHAAGDQAILHVARSAHDRARETDIVARVGGDEFAVLMPSVDLRSAKTLAREVARRIAATVPELGPPVSVSVGIAYLDASVRSAAETMAAADADMYANKRGARERDAEGDSGDGSSS
jgi:diguanylate cyclase (GGDEF)-like protein/PAS domain S-box-containing protein